MLVHQPRVSRSKTRVPLPREWESCRAYLWCECGGGGGAAGLRGVATAPKIGCLGETRLAGSGAATRGHMVEPLHGTGRAEERERMTRPRIARRRSQRANRSVAAGYLAQVGSCSRSVAAVVEAEAEAALADWTKTDGARRKSLASRRPPYEHVLQGRSARCLQC